ncbi:MAG: RHS repeat-associated core domain-containing protein [Elusimicrobiales bacterium]
MDGTVQRYVYDNEDIIAILDGNNTPTETFTHGPGIDEPLLMTKLDGKNYYYHADGVGSIKAITDNSKQIVETYIYKAYGQPTIKNRTGAVFDESGIGNPYLFTAREFDSESGLYYLRHRYYDWRRGAFTQEDPIGFNSQETNLFAFATHNPLTLVDPYGLASCSYSISMHKLQCISDDNATQVTLGPEGLFSGSGGCKNNPSATCVKQLLGPIPPGVYLINPDERNAHLGMGFYRLEPVPAVRWWEYYTFMKRNGFMLHPGGISAGCITADKNDLHLMGQYNAIRKLLDNEVGKNILIVGK